ncbi:MAG: sigma-70 family RNA polymerase sigma factor [Anaerolineae bacterium]|nr:sigma-70 family RNA polymerase sigma factor [Anaerolineae bacterium]
MAQRSNDEWLAELTSPDQYTQAEAIEALRKRLQRGIYYYLSRERSDLIGHPPEMLLQMSEDFAQDAVLRVLDNLNSFRGDSQFTTWAMKIASRVAVSELRRARYKDFSLDNLTAEGEIMVRLATNSPRSPSPERATEQEDVVKIISRGFEEVLTDRQRLALEAVTLRGIPMDTVAEQLDTNRNALYKLLHDARKKLKAYLEDQGLGVDYVMNLFDRQ